MIKVIINIFCDNIQIIRPSGNPCCILCKSLKCYTSVLKYKGTDSLLSRKIQRLPYENHGNQYWRNFSGCICSRQCFSGTRSTKWDEMIFRDSSPYLIPSENWLGLTYLICSENRFFSCTKHEKSFIGPNTPPIYFYRK